MSKDEASIGGELAATQVLLAYCLAKLEVGKSDEELTALQADLVERAIGALQAVGQARPELAELSLAAEVATVAAYDRVFSMVRALR